MCLVCSGFHKETTFASTATALVLLVRRFTRDECYLARGESSVEFDSFSELSVTRSKPFFCSAAVPCLTRNRAWAKVFIF
jgi:hypothetical protein